MQATTMLDLIGNTPIVKVQHIDTGCAELFIKLECQNPSGSIKDRIGLKMIEMAEQEGKLKPGMTIIEATAGNTGLGLALVAAIKGYELLIVLPDKMSKEKIFHLRAMGAKVMMTRSDVGKGHSEYYQDMALRIAQEMGDKAYFINQFGNPHNPLAHELTTAPEIFNELDNDVDAIVCGMGSSGTITGISKYIKDNHLKTKMVLADPAGSVLTHYVKTGEMTQAGSWLVEGIGEDFIPDIADMSLISEAFTVTDCESFHAARELLCKEGIFGGSSSGTLLHAALQYCRAQTEPKRVLTFACDSGNKYLSKLYDDNWMFDQGFIKRQTYGDLRDVIGRLQSEKAIVTVRSDEPIMTAHKRMRIHDVSQLPVLDDGKLMGIIDESDMLLAARGDKQFFAKPVSDVMTKKLEVLPHTAAFEDLFPIFNKDYVAIIMKQEKFLGIITKMDMLNYLRREQEC